MEPQTAIDLLDIKLWVGNKRKGKDLKEIIQIHNEKSYWSSGLPTKAQSKHAALRFWSDGWVEEVNDKLRSRNIQTMNEEKQFEVKTKNEHVMEWAIE